MHKDLEKILITEEEIHEAAKRLAAQIERDYEGEQDIVLVGLLKGSVQFMADLLKNIDMMCTIDFMCVSSYGKGTKSTGRVNIIKDLSEPIDDKNVIIVEDIIDSGNTLSFIAPGEIEKQWNETNLVLAATLGDIAVIEPTGIYKELEKHGYKFKETIPISFSKPYIFTCKPYNSSCNI